MFTHLHLGGPSLHLVGLGWLVRQVHARWLGPDGKLVVRALAVASEPEIFWDGSKAAEVIAAINVPQAAGYLEPADPKFNGPSGRSLDGDFLHPLGLTRSDAWLCDLVPHACMNPGQKKAIDRAYEPRRASLGLPVVNLPNVPKAFANQKRREAIVDELEKSRAEVVVLLGDQPIHHWLHAYDPRWSKLADFGNEPTGYGRLHPTSIRDHRFQVLPLAHPRQAAQLGKHSGVWTDLHAAWKGEVAPRLLQVRSA